MKSLKSRKSYKSRKRGVSGLLPVQVGDELVLVVTHTGPEVSDAHVRLLGPAEIRLGDEHVAHRQHAQPAQLLRGVEHHRRETTGHFRVQTDLNTGLDLVFTLEIDGLLIILKE